MPRYTDSLTELTEMQRGVGSNEVVDVWPEICVSKVSRIEVGDLIAVKWSKQKRSHDFTWCTVLNTTSVSLTSVQLTLMHEQAAPSHVTYSMTFHDSGYEHDWLVFNFDNAAEHKRKIHHFVSQIHRPATDYTSMQEWCDDYQCYADCYTDTDGVLPKFLISSLSPLPGDFQCIVPESEVGTDYNKANIFVVNDREWDSHLYTDAEECANYFR